MAAVLCCPGRMQERSETTRHTCGRVASSARLGKLGCSCPRYGSTRPPWSPHLPIASPARIIISVTRLSDLECIGSASSETTTSAPAPWTLTSSPSTRSLRPARFAFTAPFTSRKCMRSCATRSSAWSSGSRSGATLSKRSSASWNERLYVGTMVDGMSSTSRIAPSSSRMMPTLNAGHSRPGGARLNSFCATSSGNIGTGPVGRYTEVPLARAWRSSGLSNST
mmetsp:Transcript_14263/g.46839  ORF Transcript_14263/g.46839 Transcript_14263/m.46839 type:complete len:224 (-) Transcript_14263:996-1667(-)